MNVTLQTAGKTVLEIFTDGSSITNRDGGWAYITNRGDGDKVGSGGRSGADNMEMELMAVVEALKDVRPGEKPTVYTDFLQGTSENIAFFIRRQKAKHSKKEKKTRKSALWVELARLMEEKKPVFKWVKGHSGNPGNERADYLARLAAEQQAAKRRLDRVA